MKSTKQEYGLRLLSVDQVPGTDVLHQLFLKTDNGTISCLYHPYKEGDTAVIFVGGVVGGLDGPAGKAYQRWAEKLLKEKISSLRMDYRYGGDLLSCVLDTLMGIEFLKSKGKSKVVLVGHSFGGAVVIQAGAVRRSVTGVVALSSQASGTDPVAQLSPRPLLLIHGVDDEILSDSCSKDIYERAKDPKRIVLYQNCRHGLDECKDQLDVEIISWIKSVLLS